MHKTIHGKLKIEQHEPYYKPGVNSDELSIQQMRISTNKEKHMQFEIKKKPTKNNMSKWKNKNEMKYKTHHTVGRAPKVNHKIVKKGGKIDITNIHIPNLPYIVTGISIKSGGVILKATMRLNRQKITQNPGIIYLYGKETGNSLEIKQKTIAYLH